MIKNNHIDFDFSIFLNADYTQHSGSCIKHQIHELTDIHNQYGGMPDTYTIKNTLIHQLWWDNTQVDFETLGKLLGMEVVTISSIKQPPGNIIPWHRDTFFQIKQRFPDRKSKPVRANIYLEDYKMGHFLQYEINGDLFNSTHWVKGDYWMWDDQHLHLGANCGFENKYTLQVSGYLL